jgi:hypothetical protein
MHRALCIATTGNALARILVPSRDLTRQSKTFESIRGRIAPHRTIRHRLNVIGFSISPCCCQTIFACARYSCDDTIAIVRARSSRSRSGTQQERNATGVLHGHRHGKMSGHRTRHFDRHCRRSCQLQCHTGIFRAGLLSDVPDRARVVRPGSLGMRFRTIRAALTGRLTGSLDPMAGCPN